MNVLFGEIYVTLCIIINESDVALSAQFPQMTTARYSFHAVFDTRMSSCLDMS